MQSKRKPTPNLFAISMLSRGRSGWAPVLLVRVVGSKHCSSSGTRHGHSGDLSGTALVVELGGRRKLKLGSGSRQVRLWKSCVPPVKRRPQKQVPTKSPPPIATTAPNRQPFRCSQAGERGGAIA